MLLASKLRQTSTGEEEMHGKALNERERRGRCNRIIRNDVKSRVAEMVVEGNGLSSESDCDLQWIRAKRKAKFSDEI
jgi:hypothetical protein